MSSNFQNLNCAMVYTIKVTLRMLSADLVTRNGGGSGALARKLSMLSWTGASSLVWRHSSCNTVGKQTLYHRWNTLYHRKTYETHLLVNLWYLFNSLKNTMFL